MEKLKLIIDDEGKIVVWMDGCLLKGVRLIEFCWEVGEVPIHKLEFITQASKIERKYSSD